MSLAALYGVLIWAPLARGAYRGWPLVVVELLTLAGLVSWILSMVADRRLEWRRTALDLPVGLLLTLVLVQVVLGNRPLVSWALAPPPAQPDVPAVLPVPFLTLGSVAPAQTVQSLLLFFTYLGVYVLVVNLARGRRQLDRLVRTLLVLGGVLAFLGLVDYLTGQAWLITWREDARVPRLAASFVNPDHFGAWLAMLVALGVGYLTARQHEHRERTSLFEFVGSREARERTIRRVLPIVSVCVMALALVFTLSRGAILGLLLTTVAQLIVLAVLGQTRRTIAILGSVLSVIVAYGAWIGLAPIIARLSQDAFSARLALAESSLPMFKSFPVLGVGLGAYRYIYPRYQPPSLHPGHVYFPYAHDDLLQLGIEVGVVGTAIVLFAMWRVARDLLGSHVLGRGSCPVGGGEGRAARRNDPFSLGIAVGGLGAVFTLIAASLFDFSARIPANGVLAAAGLGLATAALHTRFTAGGQLLTAVWTRALGSGTLTRIIGTALPVAVATALVPLIVRPALAGADLQARARLELAAGVEAFDAAVAPTGQPAPPEARRQAALMLLNGALRDFTAALSATPSDPGLHDQLGWAHNALAVVDTASSSRHRATAFAHLRRAIALSPENPFLHRSLAVLAASQGRDHLTTALTEARGAIQRDPDLLEDLVARFERLHLDGREWLALAPEVPLVQLRLASLLEARGHLVEAESVSGHAVAHVEPLEQPLARWIRGTILFRTGDAAGAIGEIDAAIRQEPENPELYLARAEVLAARGNPDALGAYRAAVESAAGVADPSVRDGWPFHAKGLQARRLVSERLGGIDRLPAARYRLALARYLNDRKLWAQAIKEWNALIAEDVQRGAAYFGRGVALDGEGAVDEALASYAMSVAADGRDVRYRARLARRLWETEHYFQAINHWRIIAEQEPRNAEVRLALARGYLKVGDRFSALREYRRALDVAPDSVEARDGFARLGGMR